MLTSKEREESFRKDLDKLLKKHKAEIEVTDDGKPYGLHSAICKIYLDGVYDKDTHECIAEYTDFLL